MGAPRNVTERFWEKVLETDTCWLWTGCKTKKGYGCFTPRRSYSLSVHRFAWYLLKGDIPDGLSVLHKCDVRNCVNPDHLYLGTQKQNVQDRVNRKRSAIGEKAGRAKLKTNEVIQIRELYSTGKYTQWDLSDLFGVERSVISRVTASKTWRHLPCA
jgi:predicted XRE-type DNA-binding protein